MSQMEIDRVLSQIRSIRAQTGGTLGGIERPSSPIGVSNPTPKVSFASVLKSGLDRPRLRRRPCSSSAAHPASICRR
jgi:hypothetical protein